jgi:hypothetical protein
MTTIGIESLHNQKIYFICSGTSTNDIIKSINNSTSISKEKKSFYDLFFSKKNNKKNIVEDEFSQLDELGIKEMYMCQQNSEFEKIVNNKFNPPKGPPYIIYTSLDYSCIESASVLFYKYNIAIYPLPNISNNTNIKDKKTFDRFKKKFGNYKINNYNKESISEQSNINNYWNKKAQNINNYLNIKKTSAIIDWTGTYKKDSSELSHYNYSKFKKLFNNKCLEKYKTYSDIYPQNSSKNINNFIFISDSKFIIDNLKEVRDIKYKKDMDIVERSSIWEINLNIDFEYDKITKKIVKKIIKYNRFTKIYPTENNYLPLKYNNGDYEYKYNNITYKLFNSLNNIPINYIKDLYFYRYPKNKQLLIKKKLEKDEKNEKNEKNNNNKILSNRNNSIKFENLK